MNFDFTKETGDLDEKAVIHLKESSQARKP